MINKTKILISIDFRSERGGIARVANLMDEAIHFEKIYSLHGEKKEPRVKSFNGRRIPFLLTVLLVLFFLRPNLVAFDHLNIARLLIFLPRVCVKKVILFVYDEEVWKPVAGLRKKALQIVSDILCISDHSMQKFLEKNPGFQDKTKLCLLAGVPEKFQNKTETRDSNSRYIDWIKSEHPYCIFVSRLWKEHRYKGYFELLEAFRDHYRLSEKPIMRLALIGNGNDAENILRYIEQKNLNQQVRLFSGVTDAELCEFYENSSGLIFPSTREGFGFVFLEAMYFKKACIGIVNQPAEEIIIDGETGLLLPDSSPQSLKLVIHDMELNPEKYQTFGNRGYERYLTHFTNDHFKDRFLNAINHYNN